MRHTNSKHRDESQSADAECIVNTGLSQDTVASIVETIDLYNTGSRIQN